MFYGTLVQIDHDFRLGDSLLALTKQAARAGSSGDCLRNAILADGSLVRLLAVGTPKTSQANLLLLNFVSN